MLGARLAAPERLSTNEAPVSLAELAFDEILVALCLQMAAPGTNTRLVVADGSSRQVFRDISRHSDILWPVTGRSVLRPLLQL